MSENTRIDWAQATINPLGWGCYGPNGSAEKPNRCPWCYAHRMAKRNLRDCPQCRAFVPHYHKEEWAKIKCWRRPRRIFVQSMGDLWGSGPRNPLVADELTWIAASNPHHTFIALTKCPKEMKAWSRGLSYYANGDTLKPPTRGLPPNLWLGVSVTNQADANERIPLLLQTPAAVTWVSYEPALAEVDLSPFLHPFVSYFPTDLRANYRPALNWVVIGAQTGPGAVLPRREWIESTVEQCRAAGVPIFLKANLAKVWGEPLIQEYPERQV